MGIDWNHRAMLVSVHAYNSVSSLVRLISESVLQGEPDSCDCSLFILVSKTV